jgi:hypothetical protein
MAEEEAICLLKGAVAIILLAGSEEMETSERVMLNDEC